MINVVTLDELREARCRLSEQCGNDVHRYAEMLREMAKNSNARYITEPLPRPELELPDPRTVSETPVPPDHLPAPVAHRAG